MIRKVELGDAEAICNIYNYYVENTTITFEEKIVSEDEMKNRIETIISELPYIVFENDDGVITGYAYAIKWRPRTAYRYAVETSIYIDLNYRGKGTGTALYNYLLNELKEMGYHTALGVISMPNESSLRLHEKIGFKKVAHLTEVGFKFGKWIDVGYWQYLIK